MKIYISTNVKQNIKIFIILTIICLLPVVFSFVFMNTFQLWNAKVNDLFFKFRFFIKGSEKISPELYFFAITDSFDSKYTDIHMDRTIYADILEKFYSAKVKTILWDIMFSGNRTGDEKLVDISRKSGNIYYPYYFHRRTEKKRIEYIPVLEKKIFFIPALQKHKGDPQFVNPDSIIFPFKALAQAAVGLGFSNADADGDGIKRTIPLFYQSEQGYHPSLVLSGICDFLQVDTSHIEIYFGDYIKLPDARFYGIKKDFIIPIDKKGKMIINFPGPVRESIAAYPLENVIEAMKEDDLSKLLEDTFIFIGDISTRGKDFSQGIFDHIYPNSFVLGCALNTILTENYITSSYPEKNYILFILILILFFLFRITFSHRSPKVFLISSSLFFLIMVFLILGINFICFIIFNNIPQTVELLLVTVSAVFVLFVLKFLYSQSADHIHTKKKKPGIDKVPMIPLNRDDLITRLKVMGIVTDIRIETAELWIDGLSSKKIADRLNVGEPAIKKRIQQIHEICGVRSKSEFIKKVYGIK